MKKFSTTFLIALSSIQSFGQNYHPLIRMNTYWDELHTGPEICNLSSGQRNFFLGDTILGAYQYKVIHSFKIVNINDPGPFCPPFAVDPSVVQISSFMREDSAEQKVYVYDLSNHTDEL